MYSVLIWNSPMSKRRNSTEHGPHPRHQRILVSPLGLGLLQRRNEVLLEHLLEVFHRVHTRHLEVVDLEALAELFDHSTRGN